MLSLHAALKLEVLTPTCLGTGVKMLMLMAGIYSRQCSDPSPAMSGLDCGGQSEVKEGRGACFPITGDDEAEKRASSVLRRGGEVVSNIGAKASWIAQNTLAAEGWVVCCQG